MATKTTKAKKLTAEIAWGTTRQEIYFWKKFRGLLSFDILRAAATLTLFAS